MAKVSSTRAKGKLKLRPSLFKKKDKRPKVKLPLKHTLPGGSLRDFSVLMHGEKKVGKTSLANQGEDMVFFLQHDPTQKTLRRLEYLIPDWLTYLDVVKRLHAMAEAGKFPYDRVVLDRADIWFHNCQAYICQKFGVAHPQEVAWGECWSALRTEFARGVRLLLDLPNATWFICHSVWKEVETRDGDTVTKLSPALTRTAEETLSGLVDAWIAYDYSGSERVLCLQGSDRIGAGHRLDGHFLTTDGKPIRTLHAKGSAKAAFKQLERAFDNKIETTKYRRKKKR